MKRQSLAVFLFLFCTVAWAGAEITVYKDPNCPCCSSWVALLRENNYSVTEVSVEDVSVYKTKYNVPAEVSGCHTAIIGDYVIEGHVPVADIKRLLEEKPDIIGLAVPGMPLGSPGMEMGGKSHAFDVLAINKDGTTTIYSSYAEKLAI